MTMTLRSGALIALACALAACGSDKSATSAASGSDKVLEGTISDDMIAYDTLRSQPPAAKIVTDATGSPGSGAARGTPDGDATEAAAQQGTGDAADAREPNGAAASAGEDE